MFSLVSGAPRAGGMACLHDVAGGRDAQRLLFDALAAAAQYASFAGIDEPREAAFEYLVDHVTQYLDPRFVDLRQLGNDLDFNHESRIHQALHLYP